MKFRFHKYHAHGNDFLLIENSTNKLTSSRVKALSQSICDRKKGVGADGLLLTKKLSGGLTKVDVYNADGGWAEISGNGLRIAALHQWFKNRRKKSFTFIMGAQTANVKLIKTSINGGYFTTELGVADFESRKVPVKTKSRYLINAPLNIEGVKFPVTCLSVGNPHTVLFVNDFDFDWRELGHTIEIHSSFPKRTNVEFVKVLSRKKLRVAEWERGAGATGSSGTGAAAAVSAAIMLGLTERKCKVDFESGSLLVFVRRGDNVIELTGPAEFICEGTYSYK
jgi:diaminopimelate epimerase